jgi:hypothetical protein
VALFFLLSVRLKWVLADGSKSMPGGSLNRPLQGSCRYIKLVSLFVSSPVYLRLSLNLVLVGVYSFVVQTVFLIGKAYGLTLVAKEL